ncbi:hypothetical protein BDV3_005446 [Batrachochytrium dendrobatidis]
MLVSSVVALLATAASVVSADLPKYSLIKTDRDAGRFTFVPTTRAQKEITVKNAENILTAWVNYDSKIANYGSAADPFPIMKSENQFKSGDGANDFGGQRNALRYIGTIYGSVDRLPTVDSISLKFKSLSDNQEYTIAVPYVTSHSDVCWELSSTLYQRVANITLPGTPTGSSGFASFDIAEHERQRMIDAEDAIRNPVAVNAVYAEMANVEKELFGSVSASADTSSFKFIETDLKGISWGVYKPESKNMGVIKLDNFSPKLASTGTDASSVATSFVRRLLTHELKDTSSIVFELRELTNPATGSTYANMLSVGIRQSVRNGKYDGQLIEDTGIKSDIVVRANWSDLQPNSTTNTQYDRIADNLSRIGKTNGQADTMFVAEPFSIEANMGEFKLGAEVSGIEDITITSDDGKKVLATQKLTSDHHNVTISSKSIGSEIGTQRIAIIGSTKGKQIIKTYRIVRVVPTDEQRVHIATTPFTFNGTSSSVGLFNNAETAPGDGWNLNNGKWIVGNGTLYNNNVVTSLEVFMTAPVGTQVSLNLDVNLDCEKEFDYLGLLTKSDNKETPLITTTSRLTGRLIPGVSGKDAVVKGAYPFTTTTEKFSVILRFTSDRIGGAFKGATINSFTASAAK